MQKFEWRITARIVAYLDMILSLISLEILLVFFVAGVEITYLAGTNQEELMEMVDVTSDQLTTFVIGVWVVVILYAIAVFVKTWAAAMLLNATKGNAEYSQAFRCARIWRNVSLLYLVAGSVFLVANGYYLCMIIASTAQLFVIFVVHKFMGELDTAISNGGSAVMASQQV